MKHMEIERKFLVNTLPADLESYPHKQFEQAYLCTDPVVRIRREDDEYFLTYKSGGLLAHAEYNLPLHAQAFAHLLPKADGHRIRKTRYYIPHDQKLTIELDIFDAPFAPLILAEVEFDSVEEANAFVPPAWFGKDVTDDPAYHNNTMSKKEL